MRACPGLESLRLPRGLDKRFSPRNSLHIDPMMRRAAPLRAGSPGARMVTLALHSRGSVHRCH
jgi:hypothetical protein